MHALQICTPGPATSLATFVFGLPQKEHQIFAVGSVAVFIATALCKGFPDTIVRQGNPDNTRRWMGERAPDAAPGRPRAGGRFQSVGDTPEHARSGENPWLIDG